MSKLDFINAFIESVSDTFDKMIGIQAKSKPPLKKVGNIAYGEYSAIISMCNDSSIGSLAISFPTPVIKIVAKNLLREEVDTEEELVDAVGELVNIIYGSSKKILEDSSGIDYEMTTPEMLHGSDHEILHAGDTDVIVIPFTTEIGDFHLEISFGTNLFKN